MATAFDLKRTVSDTTPVYAVVGAADLAVEKAREARIQAERVGSSIAAVDPQALQQDLTASAEKALERIQDAPEVAFTKTLELAGKVHEQYTALAVRGELLVARIREQKATQDLFAQVDQTVAVGKGAMTTVRKAVADTQVSAKATITTGRHQVAKVADVVSDVVSREAEGAKQSADVVADAAVEATKATRTAAKRTSTTARKGAAATTSRAKATRTTATKTATTARKATTKAAERLGA